MALRGDLNRDWSALRSTRNVGSLAGKAVTASQLTRSGAATCSSLENALSMARPSFVVPVLAVIVSLATVVSCGREPVGPLLRPASVTLAPSTAALAIGDSVFLHITVSEDQGQTVRGCLSGTPPVVAVELRHWTCVAFAKTVGATTVTVTMSRGRNPQRRSSYALLRVRRQSVARCGADSGKGQHPDAG
jgi:hypothetical protein